MYFYHTFINYVIIKCYKFYTNSMHLHYSTFDKIKSVLNNTKCANRNFVNNVSKQIELSKFVL